MKTQSLLLSFCIFLAGAVWAAEPANVWDRAGGVIGRWNIPMGGDYAPHVFHPDGWCEVTVGNQTIPWVKWIQQGDYLIMQMLDRDANFIVLHGLRDNSNRVVYAVGDPEEKAEDSAGRLGNLEETAPKVVRDPEELKQRIQAVLMGRLFQIITAARTYFIVHPDAQSIASIDQLGDKRMELLLRLRIDGENYASVFPMARDQTKFSLTTQTAGTITRESSLQ